MKHRFRLLLPVAIIVACRYADSQDLQRGLRNYQDVIAGRKKLEQLTPQEQQEVLVVYRRLKAAQNRSADSSACREARERSESAAAELADRSRKLRNCAEAQDYTDDCETEFRRVRNAHGDYESAVSQVRSECE